MMKKDVKELKDAKKCKQKQEYCGWVDDSWPFDSDVMETALWILVVVHAIKKDTISPKLHYLHVQVYHHLVWK